MGRTPIFKQDNPPASPLTANHLEKPLMGSLVPRFGNEQGHRARLNVNGTVDDPTSVVARNGNLRLVPDITVATVEGRRLRNNGFIQHQNDSPFMSKKAAF
jgi:hypothetical protein